MSEEKDKSEQHKAAKKLEQVIKKQQSVKEIKAKLIGDIGEEVRPPVTSDKLYDMICYRGKLGDLWDLIRPFTKEEHAKHRERFGKTKYGITSFDNGGRGAWPGKIAIDYPIWGYKGVCRAYKCVCELLPRHFNWERINPEETNEEFFAFGGTLIDERIRLANPVFLQRAETRPQL